MLLRLEAAFHEELEGWLKDVVAHLSEAVATFSTAVNGVAFSAGLLVMTGQFDEAAGLRM